MMGGSRSTRGGSFWGEACAMSEDIERTVSPAAPPGNVPAQRTARQRRPTGALPPLPHPFRVSTTAWLVQAVAVVACIFLFSAARAARLALLAPAPARGLPIAVPAPGRYDWPGAVRP